MSRKIFLVTLASLFPLAACSTVDRPAQPRTNGVDARTANDCEATAATRVRGRRGAKCTPAANPTRTYTREELESTGEIDNKEALKRLDPRID